MKFKILNKDYEEKEIEGMTVKVKDGDEETQGEIVGYVENLAYPHAVFIIKQFKINEYFNCVKKAIKEIKNIKIHYFRKTLQKIGNGIITVEEIVEILDETKSYYTQEDTDCKCNKTVLEKAENDY